MLRQLCNPLKNGNNMKASISGDGSGRLPAAWPVLLAMLIVLPFFTASPAVADKMPIHRLTLTFDVESNTMTGLSEIELPPGIDGEISLKGLSVKTLTTKIGDTTNENLDSDEKFPETLQIPAQDVSQTVSILYEMQIAPEEGYALNRIGADGITLTGCWHPAFSRDCLFELSAVVPAGYEAVSEADTINSKVLADGGKEVRFEFPHPVEGIHFVAGPYVVENIPFGDNQMLYTYFFAEDQELAKTYRDKTLAYLARYQKLIGPYPYKRYAVVESRLPSGSSMPTFTLLGQSVAKLSFIPDTSLGHEVLHAWFGNAVRIDEQGGNWAEGLTTYLADQSFARDNHEDAQFRKEQLIKYQSYIAGDDQLALKDFTGGYSHLAPIGKEMRAVGYEKGSMVFHMLYKKLGETRFMSGVQDFYIRKMHQKATWEDLKESFESVSNTSLDDFFSQWLNRPDVPFLQLGRAYLDESEGEPYFIFTLIQHNKKPYILTVPIVVTTPNETIKKDIFLQDRATEVDLPLTDYPTELVIDPDYDLMRWLTPHEMPPVWSRFLGSKNKLAVVESMEEDTFQPLHDYLKSLGCKFVTDEEVTDDEIANAAIIFLGTDLSRVHSLFADPGLTQQGFTIDVREHPLCPGEVIIIAAAENSEQVAEAAGKLRHYGKYSYLHFEDGKIKEKKTAPSETGLQYTLDQPPLGIELSEKLTFDKIMNNLKDKKVVYVGETHTRVEDHLLQLRVIRAMYEQNPQLAIGMEMFSRLDQEALDEYVANEITEWEFLKKSHYFKKWGFDYRFYRGIINFARQHDIPLVALNLEKDIVSKVFKEGGICALDEEESEIIPPDRKLDIPGYSERIARAFASHGPGETSNDLGNFIQAQALWDETMAESVTDFLEDHPEYRMVVVAGGGHTDKETGIPPRVARRLEGIKQAVIVNALPTDIEENAADYMIYSPPRDLPPAPLLGVILQDSDEGLKVEKLSPHGKAGASGVREGDIILALDDETVENFDDLKIIMLYKKVGDKARLRIKRHAPIFGDTIETIEVPL